MSRLTVDFMDPNSVGAMREAESKGGLVQKSLTVVTCDAATVYPGIQGRGGGVVDANGCFVEGTSWYVRDNQQGPYSCDEVAEDDGEVVFLGMFLACWGHGYTDSLSHLWFLSNKAVPDRIKHLRFVYTISFSGRNKFFEHYWGILRAAGFDPSQFIRIEKPTRFKKVYVPERCFWYDKSQGALVWTQEYVDLMARMIRSVEIEKGVPRDRKVYFSRVELKDSLGLRQCWGENLIEEKFREKGFEIFYPERLSFDEMVRVLQCTRVFASTDGSCAVNAFFLKSGMDVVVIRKSGNIDAYQSAANQFQNLNVTYVDAHCSHFHFYDKYPQLGPFFLCINNCAARYFGCRKCIPLLSYLKYLLVWLKFRLKGRIASLPLLGAVAVRVKGWIRKQR